ncbi:uncharacterized protein LOC141641738 [Silene latifolia]|uniref:uncharacterized protein LOC141641738 n=1 Tax=Silene latifolia TaxID=37657 RepID=UPI003D77A3EC
MEQRHTVTTTASATEKTTILDIPADCWKIILSKLHTHHQTHIAPLSLTCKHLLSITNTLPFSLTLTPPLLRNLNSLLLPLLRRFSTSLQILSINSSAASVNAALSFIVSSTATAHLRCIHFCNLDALPLDGLRHLGSSPNIVKVLTLCNIDGLCDRQLVIVCLVFTLIEEIDVSFNNLSDAGISGLARHLKFLRKINLSENVLITDKSMIALSDCCLDLTDVKVHGCKDITQNGIGYVMRHSAKLSGISMDTFKQTRLLEKSESLFSIENSIGFCRNLSKLEFFTMNVEDTLLCSIAKANLPLTQYTAPYCTNSLKASSSGLSTFLRAYPKLEKLDIRGETYLMDETMKGLICYLGNLVAINIGYCNGLTTSTFQMLVKNCPALEEMNAMHTLLGKGELDEPLVKVDNIKCLKLASNYLLMDDMLEKIGLMCPNLEHLDVSFCEKLTSEGIRNIVKCCRELKHLDIAGWIQSMLFETTFEGSSLNLEVLKLKGGKFGDECISEIVKACPKLLYLNLAECWGVTAKSVKELVENCTNLRELDLQRCSNVSAETLAWIVSARPSLRIITSPIKYRTY